MAQEKVAQAAAKVMMWKENEHEKQQEAKCGQNGMSRQEKQKEEGNTVQERLAQEAYGPGK